MRFRRAALALVAAAGLAGLAGCATSGQTPLCDQARGLVDQGQLAQAAELFARAQVRNEGACADDGLTEVGDRYTMAYTDAARGSAAEIEGRTDLARSAYESALRLDAGNQAASNGLVRLGLPPAERSAPLPLPAVAPYPQASWWTGWQLALPALVLAVLAVVGVGLLWRRGGIGRSRSGASDRLDPDDGGARPAAFLEWRGRGWRRRGREDEDPEPRRPADQEEERGVRSADLGVSTGDGREWSRGVGVGGGRADRASEAGGATSGGGTGGGGVDSFGSAEAGAAGGAAAGGRAPEGAGGRAPEGAAGRPDLGRADRPSSAEAPTTGKEKSWLSRGRDLGRGKSKRGRRTQQEADARWARMREDAEPEPTEMLPPDSRPLPAATGAAAAPGVLAAGEIAAERQEAEPSSAPREVEPTPRREAEPSSRSEAQPSVRDGAESDRSEAEPTSRSDAEPSAPGGDQTSDRGGEAAERGEALASGAAGATAARLSEAQPSDRSEEQPAEKPEPPAGAAGTAHADSSESEPSAQQDQPEPESREARTEQNDAEPPISGDAASTTSSDAASVEAHHAASERPAAAQPSAAGALAAGLGAVAAQASAGQGTPRPGTQPSDAGEPSASAADAEPTPPVEPAAATGPEQATEPAAETPAEGPTDSGQPAHSDEPRATPTGAVPTDRPTRTVVELPEPATPSDDELVEERAAAEAPTVPEAAAAAAAGTAAAVAAVAAQAARPAETGPPAEKSVSADPALRSQLATLDLELGQLQRILNRSLRTDRDGGPPRFFAAREPVKGPAVAVTLEIVSLQLTGGDHTGSTVCVRRTVFAERPPGPWAPEDPDNRWQDVAEEVDHRGTGSIRDSDGRMWITPGREELRSILLDLDRVRPAWLPLLLGDEPSASLPLAPPPSDQVTGLKAALDGAQPLVSPQPRPSGVRLLAIIDALLAGPTLTNVRVDAVANEVLALAAAESVEHELDRHLIPLGR